MAVIGRCPNPTCGKPIGVNAAGATLHDCCPHCGQTLLPRADTARDASATVGLPAAPEPGMLPASIGRFRILARLGAGAFGTVYRAHDPQLDREVALKVPRSGTGAGPSHLERFLREARAAAGLRHPHIVPVFDAGSDGGVSYIAAAFIKGRPLSEAIRRDGVNFQRAARITRDLAEALAYAHTQGIVHRDVKPANVLLDRNNQPHLTDFGLATRAAESARLTREGAVLGTPAYMAPEQAEGQQGPARPASDQYSLGAVLYELLTGQLPFTGPPALVLYNAVHTEPPPPRSLRPGLPRDLETVCLKAMAKRPEDRYPHCQELADDLRRWLDGEPIRARRLGLAERLMRWLRREPRLALSLLTAAAALLVAAVVASVSAANLEASRNKEQLAREAAQEQAAAADKARRDADGKADETRKALEQTREKTEEARVALQRAEESAAQAQQAQREAEEQRRRAEENAAKARTAQQRAEKVLDELRKAGVKIETAETTAKKALERERRVIYPQMLAEAKAQLQKGDGGAAKSTLERCLADQRGPEWHLLRRWAKQLQLPFKEIRLPTGSFYPTMAFSPDGKLIAVIHTGASQWAITVYDLRTRREVGSFNLPRGSTVEWLALTSDGTRVATGRQGSFPDPGPPRQVARNGEVRVWDVARGKLLYVLRGKSLLLHQAAFSPDGRHLALAGTPLDFARRPPGTRQILYDAATGKPVAGFKVGPAAPFPMHVVFSPDGKSLAGCVSNTVVLWDVATGAEMLRLDQHSGLPAGPSLFTPDGKRLLTVQGTGRKVEGEGVGRKVLVVSAARGQVVTTLNLTTAAPSSLRFSPDGKRLLGEVGGELMVWDAERGNLLLDLPLAEGGNRRGRNTIYFGAHALRFATLSSPGGKSTLRVWDATPVD